jgi:pyrroline-5-carboxylate reductase
MQVTIIGCGNIGRIFIKAVLDAGMSTEAELQLIERSDEKVEALKKQYPLATVGRIPALKSEMLMLAVKPQDMVPAVDQVVKAVDAHTLVVSMMAGITTTRLGELLHTHRIIRCMPNSPVEYGFGMTGFFAADDVSMKDIRMAERLFSAVGRSVQLDEERLMDGVTAISGSGPAYFFFFVQAMLDAALEMGFDRSTAMTLIKQTMLGAFHQMNASGRSLEELIAMVASRGGTTEAAFHTFGKAEVRHHIRKALLAAERRGRELSAMLE